ncbi:MAG TPA: hypothetical protein VIE89_34115 [Candidatus Binatia bacterium]|jgi:hypothetical protein
MKELTINSASYLLIGFLGATGLVLSLFSIGKASLSSHRAKTVVWSALAILCLCAIVLFADSVETLRAFQIVSQHVQAAIQRF